jgi:nucleotide-binding universal stress UspA family protein
MTSITDHDHETAEFERQVERAATALPHAPSLHRYRQILLAYTRSEDSIAALERVASVAAHDSEVTVITVIPFEAISASLDPINAADREWQWSCLVDATARLRNLGIDPYLEAAAGNPSAVIAETAESLEADLVILGNGHDRRWRPTLRRKSVRSGLGHRLRCDMLIVQGSNTPSADELIAPAQSYGKDYAPPQNLYLGSHRSWRGAASGPTRNCNRGLTRVR